MVIYGHDAMLIIFVAVVAYFVCFFPLFRLKFPSTNTVSWGDGDRSQGTCEKNLGTNSTTSSLLGVIFLIQQL